MQVTSRFILFGTSGGGVSAQNLPATNTATNYTPTAVASEPTTEVSAHLNGINTALGKAFVTGDIGLTSFSAAASQTNASVTGLAFANATVRGFRAIVTVVTSASLYENFELYGIQRGSDWQMTYTSVGDASGYTFSINTSGQVLYSSPAATATIKFRAEVTTV